MSKKVDDILNRALADAKTHIPSGEITQTEMMEYMAHANREIAPDDVVKIVAEVERDAENDAIYCCGHGLAERIVAAITTAGFKLVPRP